MTIAAPLELHRETVLPEWIDYNGHMNVAYYVLAFDHATDAFLDDLGLDEAYREASGHSTFAAECHITYKREVGEGDPLRFTSQLLGHDEKRIHFFHHMYHGTDGYLAATSEWLTLHVDLGRRRVAPLPGPVLARARRVLAAHGALPIPEAAGRVIKVPKMRTG
jgi:acyl-CoA thioester hydrolase